MTQRLLLCGAAALMAVIITLLSSAVPVEQKLVSIHVAHTLGDFPAVENETIERKAALADLARSELMILHIKTAFLVYPDMAAEILPMYGENEQFQAVFEKYGSAALPAIAYFIANPIGSIEWMNKAGTQYKAIKAWVSNSFDAQADDPFGTVLALTPFERGLRAIQYADNDGYDFMGQFIVDGQNEVKWIVTERLTEGISQFFPVAYAS